jgi:hypothetical protein
MAPRNAAPLIWTLLWCVFPLSPPTHQYARAALAQGRNPQALPTPGGFTLTIAARAFGRPRADSRNPARSIDRSRTTSGNSANRDD